MEHHTHHATLVSVDLDHRHLRFHTIPGRLLDYGHVRMGNALKYLSTLAVLASMQVMATAGKLHADGMLTVNGANAKESQVTVIPSNGTAYTLEKGSLSFMLEFELDQRYLVIFEHPECLTKQLYFDTEVPDDYLYDQYSFPFQVILEKNRDENVSYAGPVGYIMYMDAVNDFDYETDYTLTIDEKLREEMERYQTPRKVEPSAIAAPPVKAPTSSSATVVSATTAMLTTAPTLVKPEPVTVKADRTAPAPQMIEPVVVDAPVIKAPAPAAPVTIKVEDVPVSTEEVVVERKVQPVERKVAIEEPVAPAVERVVEEPKQAGREEELIVDKKQVTTIVRITDDGGHTTEYRRVAHKFGAVFYFMEEQSITERMYYEHTGMQRMAMN